MQKRAQYSIKIGDIILKNFPLGLYPAHATQIAPLQYPQERLLRDCRRTKRGRAHPVVPTAAPNQHDSHYHTQVLHKICV